MRIILSIAAILLLAVGCERKSQLQSRLEAAVASGATSFDFADVTDFGWDRLYVFGCYTSQATVEDTLGFKWAHYSKTSIGSSDAVVLVVFVEFGGVVHWFEQPRTIELGALANEEGYVQSAAEFAIKRDGANISLTLLDPADWRRGDDVCELHKVQMETREVNGLAGFIHFLPEYHDAKERLFPRAGIEYGSNLYSAERGLIYVCTDCEAARETWSAEWQRGRSEEERD